jgi:hypothetical protein
MLKTYKIVLRRKVIGWEVSQPIIVEAVSKSDAEACAWVKAEDNEVEWKSDKEYLEIESRIVRLPDAFE